MKTNKEINELVDRILQESIESRMDEISDKIKSKVDEYGGAPQISNQPTDMTEKLHGKQSKLDVAKPKGKITGADFAKLRNKGKSKEIDENDSIEDAEEASMQEPTYVGKGLVDNKIKADMTNKMFGSFDDEHGWFDEINSKYSGDFDFDFEEEEFPDFESLMSSPYGSGQRWFSPKSGKNTFDNYQQKFKGAPFRIRKMRGLDESGETEEGNEFTMALSNARKHGAKQFEVGGKKYPVEETETVTGEIMKNRKMKVSEAKSFTFTEDELVQIIESVIIENKKAKGMAETEKVLKMDKKENTKALKDVEKKMKDYLKNMSKGTYETNPKQFPKGNGELGEMNKKAYTPSKAVDEYIENFAYSPGMENLQYDEISPNEEWLEKTIEGSSMTGNNPEWANGVDTGLNKKINAKRKLNLYGQEKSRSYNRVTQPVDTAGETRGAKSLDKMFKKLNSESVEDESTKLLNEEFDKMKNLINYNKKTQ
jgi:hypothetical protein